MNNDKVNEAVYRALGGTVHGVMYGAVTITVRNAANGAVYWAVDRAASADPKYPALQDFLRSAGAGVGARRT